MSNLYARLVAGEDERTEALADLLERILVADRRENKARFGDFVAGVLLARATDVSGKTALVNSLREAPGALSVVTQYRINDGSIPDLVILSGGDPVCVVEVKIDAEIGSGQLEGYGNWLRKMAAEESKAALVLLTHVTPVPEEFRRPQEEGRYGVKLRSVAYWNQVSEWFADLGRAETGVDEALRTLAGEFGEFLRKEAMPTLDDAAMARKYLAESRRKLTDAVTNMQAGFEYPEDWRVGRGLVERPVGIWKYHYPGGSDDARYVYCGLCFKPIDDKDDALRSYKRYENDVVDDPEPFEIGDGFYAFVCIDATSAECRRVPGFTNNRWFGRDADALVPVEDGPNVDSRGWWHHWWVDGGRSGYARICELQQLLDADGRMGNELTKWTHCALKRTEELWNALFKVEG